jgi:hypothetical protein
MLFILSVIVIILTILGFSPHEAVCFAIPAWIIPAAISAFGAFKGGGQEAPGSAMSIDDIQRLIEAYRQKGESGIAQLVRGERENATQRLAASGLNPSLNLQQALFNPILEKASVGRAQLEGNLASAEGNLLGQRAGQQFTGEQMGFQNRADLWSGLSDLAGLGAFGLGQSGAQFDISKLFPWLGNKQAPFFKSPYQS